MTTNNPNSHLVAPSSAYYDPSYNPQIYPPQPFNAASAPVYSESLAPPRPIYPQLIKEENKKGNSSCGGCCVFLIALASLIVSIVAISLAGASFGNSHSSIHSASVQRSYNVKPSKNSYYRTRASVGVSLLRGGNVAIGYGYRQASAGFMSENYGFAVDSIVARVSSQYMLVARSIQNGAYRSIGVTVMGYNTQTLNRYGDVLFTPQATVARVLAFQVASKSDCNTGTCKSLIVFETSGLNKRIMGVVVSYQSGTVTFAQKEFEILSSLSGDARSINVSIGALDTNMVALTVSSRGYYNVANSYTSVCFISTTPLCFTETTSKDCKYHSVLPINGTKFITICDQSYAYMWTVDVHSASITYESLSKNIFPNNMMVSVGPFARMLHDNSSFIIYYLDNEFSLRALFGSIQYNRYSNPNLVGNQQSILVGTNVNPTKNITMVVSDDDNSVFFVYQQQQQYNAYTLQAASITENGQFLSLRTANYFTTITGFMVESLVTPQIVFNQGSYTSSLDGVLLFFPLNEVRTTSGSTNHYRYYDIYGGMNLFGVGYNNCNYALYCSMEVAVSGVVNSVTTNNYVTSNLYAGKDYYVDQTGEISTDAVTVQNGVSYPNKLLGVALNQYELLLKM